MDDERTGQLGGGIHDGGIDHDEKTSHDSNEEYRQALRNKKESYYIKKIEDEAKRREILLRRTLVLMLVLAIGCLLIISSLQKISIVDFVYSNGQIILGAVIVIGGITYVMAPNVFSVVNFRDLDLRRREKTELSPAAAWPFPTNEITSFDDEDNSSIENHDQFQNYFLQISRLLQEKAYIAEEKASLLLDKGRNYTLGGIVFFVVSIVAWQTLSWIHGFKVEFIYGIASCSGLFVFIEILSGWYLKQYRHYVDSSTYLLKIKAMFDKFMLAYLSQHSLSDGDIKGKRLANKALLSMLEKDIRWPNAYMLKRADANFAIEAVETLSKLSKRLSSKKKKEKIGKKVESDKV